MKAKARVILDLFIWFGDDDRTAILKQLTYADREIRKDQAKLTSRSARRKDKVLSEKLDKVFKVKT